MGSTLSLIASFCLGIGLSASAGFRVFLPLFVLSIASKFGLDLGESWVWIGSWPTIITLGVATIAEVMAYYIPFVDNLLDSIAVPLAGIAGTLLMGLSLTGFHSEVFQWGLAIIAGGGTAAAVKGTTAGSRTLSSATTAGTGNFVISSVETLLASVLSVLSVFLPILAFVVAVIILYYLYRSYRYFKKGKKKIQTGMQNFTSKNRN